MKKYLTLFACSLIIIFIAIYRLYSAYQPMVGPVGNGPNEKIIWFRFIFTILMGITALVLSVRMFIIERKKGNKDT
ncbi:hypothetical protein SD71_15075 [Cohnella kolymensis]|uniref:Uncharacterized protein n=1 Tax=Cohnella kolymensis TaxID=1590652 RepID=A0ABR5A236_9BACL|nr:hypothetical protein SD71_15075 [Cohnella kolymensis]